MSTELSAPLTKDGRLQWLGTFASAPLEQAYRAKHRRDDLWLAWVCVLGAMVRILLCTWLDYRALPANVFLFNVGCRTVFVLLSICVLVRLRSVDRLFFAWCLLLLTLSTYFIALQVPADTSHVFMTLVIVFVAYAVVPLPLIHQMLGAIPFSIAIAGILATTDRNAALTLGGAFLLTNTVGIVISLQLHRRRRREFLSSLREAQLRTELEQALAEVKTLRGHVRICAWCKKVRDEEDAWQPVESYVRRHTYAEFSHGICPLCVSEQLAQTTASL